MKLPRFRIIKKLDLFIIKTFATNLMGTFFICLFIFILQLLWRWIDDFVGKGLDFSVLAQFFMLGSITLVSQALPLAILLAALMTFGNFGEKLELLAMKASLPYNVAADNILHHSGRRIFLFPECREPLCTATALYCDVLDKTDITRE